VTNGVLYLSNAAGSRNNKINEIDVTQVIAGVNTPNRFQGATGPTRLGAAPTAGSSPAGTNGGTNPLAGLLAADTVNVANFTTQFRFQLENPNAAGISLVLQGESAGNNVAVRFNLFGNNGERINSTSLFTNGANPESPATDLTNAGIDLHSGHAFNVSAAYDGKTLKVAITDATTNASAAQSYAIDLINAIGGDIASQSVVSWT
jgi:hypothetical protein